MATHDYNIANASGSAVRQDLNNVLQAIVTNNSSDTEPGTTFSHQIWADTTADIIKIRNEANTAWIDWIKITGEPLIPDGTVALPAISFSSETDSGIYRIGANEIGIATSATERVSISDTETVFNEGGEDTNFRVEGDNEANLLFIDAGTDRIGIGDGAPGTAVEIHNTAPDITIRNTTEEDADGGRESRVIFEGEQSGGEISTLARIEASHDGTADDEAGQLIFSTNDGSDGATPTAALTIDSSQNATFAGDVTADSLNGGQLAGTRSLVINGDMRIAQRGTAAVTTAGYPVDRWVQGFATGGAVSAQQSTAVTPDDFGYSIACTVTTADASTDAADQWNIQQHIEGFNVERFLFGTANAKSVTVSFWVRGSVTGTYCMTLLGSSDGSTLDRSRVSEYTIDAANTWEYKTITVPGDTGGTWTTDNGRGLTVRFGLTAGANFQQATGSWGTTNATGSANQTQLLETLNATWHVTGVQIEAGTVDTPFEHKDYASELARCQRYYNEITLIRAGSQEVNMAGYGGSSARSHNYCYPTMREAPSATYLNNAVGDVQYFNSSSNAWVNSAAIAWVNQVSYHGFYVNVNTSGLPFLIRKTGSTDLTVQLSAEL